MKTLQKLLARYSRLIDAVDYEDKSYWLYLKHPYIFKSSGLSFHHEDTAKEIIDRFSVSDITTDPTEL